MKAWQGAVYADVPQGGTLLVTGIGPIGGLACRIACRRRSRATHHLPLGEAPDAYATFTDKGDGMVKVVFTT